MVGGGPRHGGFCLAFAANKRLALAFRIEKKRVLNDAIAKMGRDGTEKDKKGSVASSRAAFAE